MWRRDYLSFRRFDREVGATIRIRVRARDVTLALVEPTDISTRNIIPSEVVNVNFDDGAYAEVLLVASGQHLRSRITRKSAWSLAFSLVARSSRLIKSIAVEADRPDAPDLRLARRIPSSRRANTREPLMIDAKHLLDQFLGGAGGNQPDRTGQPRQDGGFLGDAGDILGGLNQRARENPLASGALAGGLAAILLGSKAGRS